MGPHQVGTRPKLPVFLKYLPILSLPELKSRAEVKNERSDTSSSHIRLDIFDIDYFTFDLLPLI
jgi:hypothetical protein